VPVIEKVDGGIKVTVGSVPHPMTDEHYIEWIELLADGKAYRQFLKPGDEPEALFNVSADSVSAREHCNVHGLWKG
jgi:superoxide reductase